MNKLKYTIFIMTVAVVALALHAWYYFPFLADDALISLRYARRLAEGRGLNWNDGERVEGYSNLLWVLAAAAINKLGLDLITAVRSLGLLCMGSVFAAALHAHRPRNFRQALPVLIALLFLSLAAPFAVWTIGGMEQPLVAGLLAWAVVLSYPLYEHHDVSLREMLLPGLFFALLCLTRLDGAVFTLAAMAAIFLTNGLTHGALKKAVGLGLLPLGFLVGQAAFRLAYYGEWVPNIALVKFIPSGKHSLDGWGYLHAGAFALSPLVALAAMASILGFRQKFMRARLGMLLTVTILWAGYIVLIGGDIFPAWRHFVPLVVLLVLMSAIGAEWVGRFAPRRSLVSVVGAAALLLCLFTLLQFRDEENGRAISERWEWDGEVIGTLLKKSFGAQQPLMAVDPAGCLPYWSELPALDMLGLNDHYLPRHPPADLGQGPIGHELGDGKYVLDRRPDLVIFLLPTGSEHGYFLSGRQMQQDPRFFRDYTLVRFEGREPYTVRSRIWVRRFSERIGIRRTTEQIDVPGFLLNGNPETIAYMNTKGALIVPSSREQPVRVNDLALEPGLWRITTTTTTSTASGGRLLLKVFEGAPLVAGNIEGATAQQSVAGTGRMLLEAQSPALLDLTHRSESTRVEIELRQTAADEVTEVHGLTIARVQDNLKE